MSAVAPLLEAFFTERLIGQRQASPNVAAYRAVLGDLDAVDERWPPDPVG
jgi:hypothetical protein